MARQKAEKGEKIIAYTIGLKQKQIDWINKNKHFKVHLFIRNMLDIYIREKESIYEKKTN